MAEVSVKNENCEAISVQPKTNFHTHSLFCDGHNSAEEMVKAAIEKRFSILGFSSHSMYPFSSEWHMAITSFEPYCAEVRRLADLYKDKIKIALGFEADYIPGFSVPRFDVYKKFNPEFLIGSVHFVYNGNGYFEADDSPESVLEGIKKLYGGSSKKAVSRYFELEREMLQKGDFTIIGHPDLIRKTNCKTHFFNEEDMWYKRELKATAKAIAQAGVISEINTGAIARGYMNDMYPSPYFLSLLHDAGVPITISSDAHAASGLDCAFGAAKERAKKAGYTEFAVPQAGSVQFYKL
jgi:histidinol-phosphatase (PHP family)